MIDADDVLADPRAHLEQAVRRVRDRIRRSDAGLAQGPKTFDGVWAPHWYNAVWQSTGFATRRIRPRRCPMNCVQSPMRRDPITSGSPNIAFEAIRRALAQLAQLEGYFSDFRVARYESDQMVREARRRFGRVVPTLGIFFKRRAGSDWRMYLRHTMCKKDGKVHRYWRLVRSVRVGRRVIQQTVAHLGELDEHGRIEARALARQLIGAPEQAQLFNDGSEHVTVPVRLKGVRIERSRQFGDVYLALALWRGIGLEELCERLLPVGQGAHRLGEDGGGAGGGAVMRAIERAAHCRGLVSPHGALRFASAWR